MNPDRVDFSKYVTLPHAYAAPAGNQGVDPGAIYWAITLLLAAASVTALIAVVAACTFAPARRRMLSIGDTTLGRSIAGLSTGFAVVLFCQSAFVMTQVPFYTRLTVVSVAIASIAFMAGALLALHGELVSALAAILMASIAVFMGGFVGTDPATVSAYGLAQTVSLFTPGVIVLLVCAVLRKSDLGIWSKAARTLQS